MPSRKWKEPNLPDFKIVELTKTSREDLSKLPVDLSLFFEEIDRRATCSSSRFLPNFFQVDLVLCTYIRLLVLALGIQNSSTTTTFPFRVPTLKPSSKTTFCLQFTVILCRPCRKEISGRKKVLANLVKYEERYRDPSFNATSKYSYQKYAHPDSFDSYP